MRISDWSSDVCSSDLLTRRLEEEGVGARRLDLSFHRVDNRIEAIRAGLAKPSRDRTQMTRLLCDRLETVHPGFGIERMQLTVPLAEPLTFHMVSNLGEAPVPDVAAIGRASCRERVCQSV